MVKPNINDWIVCQPRGGSIVKKKYGSQNCQNIKNVAIACSGVVPNRMTWFSRGPYFYASWLYYYFDGDTRVGCQLMILWERSTKSQERSQQPWWTNLSSLERKPFGIVCLI